MHRIFHSSDIPSRRLRSYSILPTSCLSSRQHGPLGCTRVSHQWRSDLFHHFHLSDMEKFSVLEYCCNNICYPPQRRLLQTCRNAKDSELIPDCWCKPRPLSDKSESYLGNGDIAVREMNRLLGRFREEDGAPCSDAGLRLLWGMLYVAEWSSREDELHVVASSATRSTRLSPYLAAAEHKQLGNDEQMDCEELLSSQRAPSADEI